MRTNLYCAIALICVTACSGGTVSEESSLGGNNPGGSMPNGNNPGGLTPGGSGEGPTPIGEGTNPNPPPTTQNDAGTTTPPSDAGTTQNTSCINDGDPLDVAMLSKHLRYLASKELDGRKPGTAGDLAARKYLADRFQCLGLTPGGVNGTFEQPVVDVNGAKTANVVAVIPGSDPALKSDVVVIGAHMDHFGAGRLGANDNGSGTVAVISAAQFIQQQPTRPKRTIAFILWASEEVNFDGSVHFVTKPTELPEVPLSRVVYYVNYDMIGSYTTNGGQVDACGAVGATPATAMLRTLLGAQPQLKVNFIPGYGSDDSDYYQFCTKGVPYVSFEMDDPPCYHKTCDTADRIDYPNMSRVAKLSIDLLKELANTATDLAAYRRQAKVADLGCSGS